MQTKLAEIFFNENNFVHHPGKESIKLIKSFPNLKIEYGTVGICKKNDISSIFHIKDSIKFFSVAIELNRENFIVNNPNYLSIKLPKTDKTNLREFSDSFNRDYFETLAKQSKKYFIIIYPDKKVSFLLIFENILEISIDENTYDFTSDLYIKMQSIGDLFDMNKFSFFKLNIEQLDSILENAVDVSTNYLQSRLNPNDKIVEEKLIYNTKTRLFYKIYYDQNGEPSELYSIPI